MEEAQLPPTPTPTAMHGGTEPGAKPHAGTLKLIAHCPQDTAAMQPRDQPCPGQPLCPIPNHQTCSSAVPHLARTHSTAKGAPDLGAQPCLPITSTDTCHPHLFPLHLLGEYPHLSAPASKSQPHARSVAQGGATAGGCQPWVPHLLLEGSVPHFTLGCCLEGGELGGVTSQGGNSLQTTQSPALWAAGQRPQPGSSGC